MLEVGLTQRETVNVLMECIFDTVFAVSILRHWLALCLLW